MATATVTVDSDLRQEDEGGGGEDWIKLLEKCSSEYYHVPYELWILIIRNLMQSKVDRDVLWKDVLKLRLVCRLFSVITYFAFTDAVLVKPPSVKVISFLKKMINIKSLAIPCTANQESLNELDLDLHSLRLNGNYITNSLPESLFSYTKLKSLEIVSFKFQKGTVKHFSSLTKLNQLKKLTVYEFQKREEYTTTYEKVCQLTQLSTLTFSGRVLGNHLANLKNLKSLKLESRYNPIDSSSSPLDNTDSLFGIQYLTKLQSLDLRHNSLMNLNGIECLIYLQTLDLGNNCLRGEINFSGLENLIKLNLEQNLLQTVPSSILGLKKLKQVNLSLNRIQKISDEVASGLIKIQQVNLKGNKITDAPKIIQHLVDPPTEVKIQLPSHPHSTLSTNFRLYSLTPKLTLLLLFGSLIPFFLFLFWYFLP